MLSLLLAFCWCKQDGCFGFIFPREFSSLFRVSRGQLGLLRLLSCGDLLLSSAVVEFVAPLRLWHGLRLLPMVGSEVSVRRVYSGRGE